MMNDLATAGGLLFFLTFFHFIFDWIPQSHADATAKSKDWWIRAVHVTIYTSLMLLPIMAILWEPLGVRTSAVKMPLYLGISLIVTWVTHFIEDTYIPVVLWAKYIRKIPEYQDLKKADTALLGMDAIQSTVTIILFIVIDQLVHITFLTVPVALAVWG